MKSPDRDAADELAARLTELQAKATPGPWRSMRDGNQYLRTRYLPNAELVGASRIEGVCRPWNPHAYIAFGFKPEEFETARFLDDDADLITELRNALPQIIAHASELATLRRRVAEMGVIGEIAAERQRQVEVEGWTAEHDDGHKRDEMARAGAWYALSAIAHGWTDVKGPQECRLFRDSFYGWPWAMSWWKPKDARRDLIRAAALIVAEIERSDRLSPPTRKE